MVVGGALGALTLMDMSVGKPVAAVSPREGSATWNPW